MPTLRPLTLTSPLEGERGFAAVATGAWRRVSIVLAWRPEWPVAVLAGVCWLLLALLSLGAVGSLGLLPRDGSHAGHAAHASSLAPPSSLAFVNAASLLMSWLLMSFAMMVPVTLPAVRHVAFNSIEARRARAMTIYVAAYMAVWGLFGVMSLTLIEAGRRLIAIDNLALSAIVLAGATAWQLTRIKRRAIVACKRTVPLPPHGLRADRACARFGVMQAWRCIVACWPLMLLMAAMPHPHPLWPMIALTIVVLVEERARNRDRLIVPIACLFAVATVAAAALAV
jgi:predicted metal-binding membrane protein